MIQTATKYATLRQLTIKRNVRRWGLEQQITRLESRLKLTNRFNYPGQWMEIEEQLGEAYRELMDFVKDD